MTATTVHIPVIATERLRLRAHVRADFDAYAALFASPRAQHMGRLDRYDAWYSLCADCAGWLLNGHGALAITLPDADTMIGQVALNRPDHFPEPELGWFLLPGHDGQGYATEAAAAMRTFAWNTLGWQTLVSYIAPENTASRKLADRLGAHLDETAPRPDGETEADTLVYRHRKAA